MGHNDDTDIGDHKDPHGIIGKEIPAADGGNYGHRVLGYDTVSENYHVQPIRWSTGENLGSESFIGWFKISYRYMVNQARNPL